MTGRECASKRRGGRRRGRIVSEGHIAEGTDAGRLWKIVRKLCCRCGSARCVVCNEGDGHGSRDGGRSGRSASDNLVDGDRVRYTGENHLPILRGIRRKTSESLCCASRGFWTFGSRESQRRRNIDANVIERDA